MDGYVLFFWKTEALIASRVYFKFLRHNYDSLPSKMFLIYSSKVVLSYEKNIVIFSRSVSISRLLCRFFVFMFISCLFLAICVARSVLSTSKCSMFPVVKCPQYNIIFGSTGYFMSGNGAKCIIWTWYYASLLNSKSSQVITGRYTRTG